MDMITEKQAGFIKSLLKKVTEHPYTEVIADNFAGVDGWIADLDKKAASAVIDTLVKLRDGVSLTIERVEPTQYNRKTFAEAVRAELRDGAVSHYKLQSMTVSEYVNKLWWKYYNDAATYEAAGDAVEQLVWSI